MDVQEAWSIDPVCIGRVGALRRQCWERRNKSAYSPIPFPYLQTVVMWGLSISTSPPNPSSNPLSTVSAFALCRHPPLRAGGNVWIYLQTMQHAPLYWHLTKPEEVRMGRKLNNHSIHPPSLE